MGRANSQIDLNSIYVPSKKVVARKIEEELIIIPIEDGFAELNDAMFSLNETGIRVWAKLDSKKNVGDICNDLAEEYDESADVIKKDVIELLNTLLQKELICKI